LDNLFFFDNLSNSEMSYLLSACDVFYSPIVLGSGMKTKIAEALSYGLYIYATEHSLIGYDEIINNKECVKKISHLDEEFPKDFKMKSINKQLIMSYQQKYYSHYRFNGHELDIINFDD
ncbi:TPA: glycosyl transferase family 1, partial [Escherichia coli]|nr:glycosyl transferase family 1 [Escherichia coli]